MAKMTIDCPNCGSPLLVPENAAGRKGRCTSCSTRFVIPSPEEMLDQTISNMVFEELDHRYHADEEDDDPGFKRPETPEPAHPESAAGTILGMPAVASDGDPGDSGAVLSIDDLSQSAGVPTDDVNKSLPPPTTDLAYPSDIRPKKQRPYLVVKQATLKGVVLHFDAAWLGHETFRCSMPRRCAFTGKGTNTDLTCRPVIFENRQKGDEELPRSIEMRHEMQVGPGFSSRQLSHQIGRMSDMVRPFDQPLFYYASHKRVGDPIRATVRTDDLGRDYCEISLPSAEVALEWLSRVNGRCGHEYALLKAEVVNLTTDAWTSLDEKARKRLEVWCKFERGERFKAYIRDADLRVADDGLGGVAITDRRLIYHKFRRSRNISLFQDSILHIRADDRHARLTIESQGRLARAGKIPRSEMNRLVEALAGAPKLRIMFGSGEDNDSAIAD